MCLGEELPQQRNHNPEVRLRRTSMLPTLTPSCAHLRRACMVLIIEVGSPTRPTSSKSFHSLPPFQGFAMLVSSLRGLHPRLWSVRASPFRRRFHSSSCKNRQKRCWCHHYGGCTPACGLSGLHPFADGSTAARVKIAKSDVPYYETASRTHLSSPTPLSAPAPSNKLC